MARNLTTELRMIVAIGVALLAAAVVHGHALAQPAFTSDFDQLWGAARALRSGVDPYVAVGPGAQFEWKWPLYYPLPAVLLVAPLTLVSALTARMLFSALSAGLFAFAITRDDWQRLPILLSISLFVSADLVQWPPLLAAAYFLPAVGVLAVAKPNFAVAIAAAARRPRDLRFVVGGAVVLVVASLLIRPGWVSTWLELVRAAPHFRAPVLRPFGFLLLAAGLRWRRPEARWLLALALIPQSPSFYDQLLLVVVCARWWETSLLALGTWVLFWYVSLHTPQPDYAAWGRLVGNATVWTCFLPCLAIVLRRPNESPPPRRPAGAASADPGPR